MHDHALFYLLTFKDDISSLQFRLSFHESFEVNLIGIFKIKKHSDMLAHVQRRWQYPLKENY